MITLSIEKHIVYTSVNFNYLGRALTLARSVKKFDPKIHFILFVVEPDIKITEDVKRFLLNCDDPQSFDEVMTLEDLDSINNEEFQNYTVIEMCTAVKGQIAVQLLTREHVQYVTYLDPDLFFYGPLTEIREMHTNGDVLLTPHLNRIPYSNNTIKNDEMGGMLRHGIFNLGFVSFKNTKSGREIAAWWADRLLISSKADYFNGLFTDQKWWDLSQIYFTDTFVVKNDGWNVAPWNISERRIVSLDPPVLESGDHLLFFHFSKFPSPEFYEKIELSQNSLVLNRLIEEYRDEFLSSQIKAEKVLSKLNDPIESSEREIKLVPKQRPNFEIFLTNFLHALARNTMLRRIAFYNSFLRNFSKKAYNFLFKLVYRIEVVTFGQNIGSLLKNLTLDLLIVSHIGGGGVSVVLRERVLDFVRKGKFVGVLKPVESGELALFINNKSTPYLVEDRISEVFDKATEIEIHHILGFEEHFGVLGDLEIDRFFLHDKYLISQTPFDDAKEFLTSNSATPGIDLPLSKSSKLDSEEWRALTRGLLQNSKAVFAPSEYIIQEYKSVFPEIEYQIFDLEPGFHPMTPSASSKKRKSFIVVSPTGAHKGSLVLADVARINAFANSSIFFRVFGDLPAKTEMELKNLENVILEGQLSRGRLNNALGGLSNSIGWIPSLTGESYSLALSDFLSNGITVLASNRGALTERLRSMPGNFLYDPAIPVEVLSNLLIALSENKDLDEFSSYLYMT